MAENSIPEPMHEDTKPMHEEPTLRPVRRSPSIAALAQALAKAQGQLEGAAKKGLNPHFKSKYADLSSVWEACRTPLSANGLSVLQFPSGQGATVTVTTILTHSSGEFLEGDFSMTATQHTPQGIGSCLTYARRYALAAVVGIAPEDDDGNAASEPKKATIAPQVPEGFDGWLEALEAEAMKGVDALKVAWEDSPAPFRRALGKAGIDRLKAGAAQADAVS